jgi:hypothetical protein
MRIPFRHLALAGLLGAASLAPAHAGLLTYQGVTFTSAWSGNVLSLEIDAASHTGDWAKAQGLAALEVDGIGNYTSVSVSAAPSGAKSWATSSSELKAKGCSGATSGQAGSRLCFYGQQIALTDNMVFSFTFKGSDIKAVDPHVKVEFVNSKGGKVGSLLSQTLPASPKTGTTAGTQSGGGAATTTQPPLDTGLDAGSGSAIVEAPVKDIPPLAELPATEPAGMPGIPQTGAESANQAAVPEPQGIALLLGGLGLMGLALRRKRG